MNTLIRNVVLNGKVTDIAIQGNRISRIAPAITGEFDKVIDGSGQAALPPFYNTHGHAVMVLLRGYADDMELFDWLNNHIWPAEACLQTEHYYWGTKLACMEMIRSGTVFFNDMYFKPQETIRAVEECGMRAAIGLSTIDVSPKNGEYAKDNAAVLASRDSYSSRIQIMEGPHAIYTVGAESLRKIAAHAAAEKIGIHIHLAETKQEFDDCVSKNGCTPAEYLDKLGILTEKTVLAHSVYLTDSDIELVAKRGCTVSHNPCSNFKLCSGNFRFHKMTECGVRVTIGTDGCASNNSLSMFDEMKMAALNAKLEFGGPLGCTAEQVFRAATRNGAEAFGIDAGILDEGKLADIMLVDLNSTLLNPGHNLISDLVYAADTSCVKTVLCDGKVLMLDRVIPGYAEALENARRCAAELVKAARKAQE